MRINCLEQYYNYIKIKKRGWETLKARIGPHNDLAMGLKKLVSLIKEMLLMK